MVVEVDVTLEDLSFTLEFEAGASAKGRTGDDGGETENELSSKESGILLESVIEHGDEATADGSEAAQLSWRTLTSASLAEVKCDELTGA